VDYYLASEDGQQTGPFSLEQMRSFWATGRIVQSSRFWHSGMTEWRSIADIEGALRPSPNAGLPTPKSPGALSDYAAPAQRTPLPPLPQAQTPIPQPPLKRDRKGIGCGMGCLLLMLLLGGFVGFLALLPTPKEEPSKPGVESSWDKGFDSGYELGYAAALTDYDQGKLKESSELLDANARGLSQGDTDSQHRDGFISGLKAGYEEGWKHGGH